MENGHSIGLHWTTLLTGRKGLLFERASRIALALFLSWLSIVQAADFTGQVVRVLAGDIPSKFYTTNGLTVSTSRSPNDT